MQIRSPSTAQEFEQYYHLRWLVLRSPWQQPPGSERDDLEAQSYHLMAIEQNIANDHNPDIPNSSILNDQGQNGLVIGVGRIHLRDPETAQIRYMAVHPDYRSQGVGSQILAGLEEYGGSQQVSKIILNARSAAVPFYERRGYTVIEPAHTLYGTIPHFLMRKLLN
jgi:ribosomal protein S18 acetylase RimI-like enzyme